MRKTSIAAAVLAVGAFLGGSGTSMADVDVPEDHYAYNCTTMGNHVCGVHADPAVVRPPAHCWPTRWYVNDLGYTVRTWHQGERVDHPALCEE